MLKRLINAQKQQKQRVNNARLNITQQKAVANKPRLLTFYLGKFFKADGIGACCHP